MCVSGVVFANKESKTTICYRCIVEVYLNELFIDITDKLITVIFIIYSADKCVSGSLCNIHSTLYTVHCTLYIVHCTLYTVHCTLYIVHCTLYTVHCTLYIVHCTLYTVHCTLYIVHCTLYTVHCTLYTVLVGYNVQCKQCIYYL